MFRRIVIILSTSGAYAWSSGAVADVDLISTVYNTEIVEYSDKQKKPFKLDGELGIIVSSGNTNASSYKGSLNSIHNTKNFANRYWAEVSYSEASTTVDDETKRVTTAQRVFASVQSDYKLNIDRQRMFFYADYENDRFNGYDYRSSIAAGWSQQLWKNEISGYRFSIGPGYSMVKAEDEDSDDSIYGVIMRGSAEYHYIWPTGAKFRQFASIEAGESNVKSRTESSLSANLFDSLALKLSFILQYNSDPADETESLDTETSVTLVYRFF